jgi:hypothetical protein
MPRPRPVAARASALYEDTILLSVGEGPIMVNAKLRYEDAEILRDQLDMLLAAKKGSK